MESRNVNLLDLIFDGIIKPRDVKLPDLERITQNFSEQRIIGEGGFAKVYKGVLRNGEIAVKRIRNDKTIDEKLFQREVSSLLKVSHKNIVRFIGFCSHTVHKALKHEGNYVYAENRDRVLCFEYINNGSLENYIADELRGLPWDTRVLVIKGICEGLQYLHMKRQIIHRDLKPENILIDNNMVAKITDFGLSRMEENAQTKSTTRVSSPGYTSPEYIDKGEISVKYDVYSLGVIIIELVTGRRSIPDSNSVLRRWMHRLRKSGKETPFIYQQIAKLIEIGLLCQEKDPYKRPFISDIIHVMNELESTDWQISNANKSTAGQISPFLEDDMLGIEPLELCFPIKTNTNSQLSCSIELTNKTNAFIAFSIQTTSPLSYFIQPKKDIVAPRSKYSVNIILQSLDKEPQDREYTGDFIVRSTKVNESVIGEDITEDTFKEKEGKLVDEVNLTITYKAEVPQVDESLGSLIISDKRNLHSPQESDVQPTEAESKINSSTSIELIKFEPPVVSFPLLPSKCLLSSIKLVNITDSHICFNTDAEETNVVMYITEPSCGVLPPWSTQELVVKRVAKKEAPKMQDIKCNDKYFVWSCFVTEDVTASDLTRYMPNTERKELPIVFTETSSNELIKFDPPELCLPLLPKQRVLSSTKIVNITDQYIGFRICTKKSNSARYYANPSEGILPPLSTKTLLVTRIAEENELEESQCKDKFLLWNGIVDEDMKANDVTDNMSETNCTALPMVLTKTNPSLLHDLIQFDPPELHFPFLPNKVSTSIKIVNLTDHNVGFNTYSRAANAAWYHTEPPRGILPPRSTQKLMVTREQKEDALNDNLFDDNYFVWKSIVSNGVKDSELSDCMADQESKQLPIVRDKVSSSISSELIQFDPAEICIPLLLNKRILFSVNIINVTDFYVAFHAYCIQRVPMPDRKSLEKEILPPRSTKIFVLPWFTDETELEDMEPSEEYFVWTRVVTEGVESGDIISYMVEEESKKLPIILTKASPCTSNELIQFDPSELSLPFMPNKPLVFSVNIVNNTDYYVGFHLYEPSKNMGWYFIRPEGGVMPPRSTQRLVVKRVQKKKEQEGMHCEDKFFLWSCLVSDGVEAGDIFWYTKYEESKELPIVYTKTSPSLSDDLIQFDPPKLHFPFLPNKKVLTSIKIVNLTDYNVGFNTYCRPANAAWYHTEPPRGILPPRSTQKIMVTREQKEDALKDNQFDDSYFVWKSIVSDGVKDSELSDYMANQESKELPIVLDKISLSISGELIQLDPSEICIPLLLTKKMLFSLNVINTTDFYVAFHAYWIQRIAPNGRKSMEKGILPPRATKKLILSWRTLKCQLEAIGTLYDLLVWNHVVTEGVESGDIISYMGDKESKKLPLILNKARPCTSNELIQFNPPELSLPFIPNKPLVFSVNLVNNTDYCVGFVRYHPEINMGVYHTKPASGIMSTRSTQRLIIKRVPGKEEHHDMQCEDKFFLWTNLVSEGVQARDIVNYTGYAGSKELPIVYKKTSSSHSDDLIQFDPPELHFPFLPNMRVLTSIKIVNLTDYNVGFNTYCRPANAAWYHTEPPRGILPPRSTQKFMVTREQKKDALKDNQFDDKYFVWNSIVSDGVKDSELMDYIADQESKQLPIVLHKTSSSISGELIQFDPPDLHFPVLPNKVLSSIKIVNLTDHNVGFNSYIKRANAAWYHTEPPRGILPPRSTKKLMVTREEKEDALRDNQSVDKYFVWNSIVSDSVKGSELIGNVAAQESKELPIVLDKASPCTSNELIQFDPPELSLPFILNKPLVFSVNVVNNTYYYVGFHLYEPLVNIGWYFIKPEGGVMPPRSSQRLVVKWKPKKKEQEHMQCEDKFLLWSRLVSEGVETSDIVAYANYKESKELPIVYKKTSLSISDELIQFDPPDLHFPILPNKVLSSIKIVNLTDHNVGFNAYIKRANAAWYHTEPPRGILPPRSTQKLMVTREQKKYALKDNQFDDKYFVWNSIVSDGVKDTELIGNVADQESSKLPIVLDKISSSISGDLIRLDPAELCIPALLNKKMLLSVNVINTTDFYVAFHAYWIRRIAPRDKRSREKGILPPRSTKKYSMSWITVKTELEAMETLEDHFVWNRVVTECVESRDIISYMVEEESKKLPFILTKASPCTSNELIQFDPPELSLAFMPKKPLVFSVNLVNNTDYCVGFVRYHLETNVGVYYTDPASGVMPPRSTQRLVVKRVPGEEEQHDMQCEDKFFLWSRLVSEGVQASDIVNCTSYRGSKELPVVYKKTSSSISEELIKFDPPDLHFPFVPNKKVLSLIKIVNLTDYNVGFNTYSSRANAAWYGTSPARGILPPRSTQKLIITREQKEDALKDKLFDDKYFMWNGIVSDGVIDSELINYMADQESKELPIVLDETNLCTSDELIQLDPPQLPFPFSTNKSVSSLFRIVNITDHKVGFSMWSRDHEDNSAWYITEPRSGILPPQKAQTIKVTRTLNENEKEDMQCIDKIFVWNRIVTEGVEASDVDKYWKDGDKELPVVLTKAKGKKFWKWS